MENNDSLDREARSAAQGLLDIAVEAGKRTSGTRNEPASLRSTTREASSAKIPAFRPSVPSMMGSGRIITSGNTPPVLSKLDKETSVGLKSPDWRTKEKFAQPKPRREQERVTLIVAKPRSSEEGDPEEPHTDLTEANLSPTGRELSPLAGGMDPAGADVGPSTAEGADVRTPMLRAMSNPVAANLDASQRGASLRRTSTDLSKRVRDLGKVTESDRKTSFDLPVPPSAFALRVSGAETIVPRESAPEAESELENLDLRSDSANLHQPQAKRPKLEGAPSLGSMLAQAQGRSFSAPQSTPGLPAPGLGVLKQPLKRQVEGGPSAIAAPQDARQNLFSGSTTGKSSAFLFKEPASREPKESNLLPRNSSDRSTLDVHRQLAHQISTETVTNLPPRGSTQARLPGSDSAFTIREPTGNLLAAPQASGTNAQILREMQDSVQSLRASAVRSMEDPSRLDTARADPPQLIGSAVSIGDDSQGSLPAQLPVTPTPPSTNQDLQMDIGTAQESETTLWSGLIKHRLKTATGSSVAELFSLNAMVPSKLIEQFPSTIFVNALVGRAKVQLGKHYVASCKLANPTERQVQKVTALASMKLVAICELQHCTITLVPNISDQGLQMVAFIIADE